MTRGKIFYVKSRHNFYESGGSLGGLPASLRAGESHDLLRVIAGRRGGTSMSCEGRGKGGTELWRDPAPAGACAGHDLLSIIKKLRATDFTSLKPKARPPP